MLVRLTRPAAILMQREEEESKRLAASMKKVRAAVFIMRPPIIKLCLTLLSIRHLVLRWKLQSIPSTPYLRCEDPLQLNSSLTAKSPPTSIVALPMPCQEVLYAKPVLQPAPPRPAVRLRFSRPRASPRAHDLRGTLARVTSLADRVCTSYYFIC